MNDFMEIQLGFDLTVDYLQRKGGKFSDALDLCHAGIGKSSLDLFNGHWNSVRNGTYVACLSEHPAEEDKLGRLSMWRAYGSQVAGTALIINPGPLFIEEDVGIFSNPVQYLGEAEFDQEMDRALNNIQQNRAFLSGLPQQEIINGLFSMFLTLTTCTKHPGFAEEREWRILHVPDLWSSKAVTCESETIAGYPQPVYKLNLQDVPEIGLTGAEPDQLLDHVIIGPNRYPLLQYKALLIELEKAGIPEADKKIKLSNIPLRM